MLAKLGLIGTLAIVATLALVGAFATYRYRVPPSADIVGV
jgi:hypothetical protein